MGVLKKRSGLLGAIVASTLLVAFGAAAVSGCGGDSPQELNGITRVPPARTDNLKLPDESPASGGREIAIKGPQGGMMLVFFGYTSCPDVCPTSMADLRLAMAELTPEQRQKVKVAMITVDPKRDTGKVLNGYLGHFFEPGEFRSLRTDDPDQLAKVEKAFGASHKLGKPNADGGYEVGHTTQVFAVNDRGQITVEWPFMTEPEKIADDIRLLLDQKSQNPDA